MTQYSDVPKVNALYQEQQQVQSGIAIIDNGGSLSSLTLAPAPPPPFDPANPTTMMTSMVMAVNITNAGTVTPETMGVIRAQLVERDSEINAELTSLGVTGSTTFKKK